MSRNDCVFSGVGTDSGKLAYRCLHMCRYTLIVVSDRQESVRNWNASRRPAADVDVSFVLSQSSV